MFLKYIIDSCEGYSQWGKSSESEKITFTISFSEFMYSVIVMQQCNIGDSAYHWDCYIQSKTISRITFPTSFIRYYIVLGI